MTKDGSMQSNAAAEASGNVTRDFLDGKTGFAWAAIGCCRLEEEGAIQLGRSPFPKGTSSQPGYSNLRASSRACRIEAQE